MASVRSGIGQGTFTGSTAMTQLRRLRSSAQLRSELLSVTGVELTGPIPSTEAHALLSTRKIRERLSTTWALGETGTAGPTGNHYGHPPASPSSSRECSPWRAAKMSGWTTASFFGHSAGAARAEPRLTAIAA